MKLSSLKLFGSTKYRLNYDMILRCYLVVRGKPVNVVGPWGAIVKLQGLILLGTLHEKDMGKGSWNKNHKKGIGSPVEIL